MTSDELDDIEANLGITLPDFYRAAAREGRLEGLLNADAGAVTAITQGFREGDFGDEDWPPHLFAFADNGCGDHYCLDASSDARAVFCRDHETLKIERVADDFDTWLDGAERHR